MYQKRLPAICRFCVYSERKEKEMLKLKRVEDFNRVDYHGFTLQKGFWYGIDLETGRYIATSGWEAYGNVAIYFKNGNHWDQEWISIEDTDFELENLPSVKTRNKKSFHEWLEEDEGISYHDYDANYSEIASDQLWEEYESYRFEGQPGFVRKYLKIPTQNEKDVQEALKALLAAFPNSFINENEEFIAHQSANEYFKFSDCVYPEDVDCKVLEYFSRSAAKGEWRSASWRNRKFRAFMQEGINHYLETDFSEEDFLKIYSALGNGINHELTKRFVESGFDLRLLEK